MTTALKTTYIDVADTAKLVRKALKAAFPQTKFSVRSSRYSLGASVSVTWTDGPLVAQVQAITAPFEGATFDAMRDLKESRYVEVDGQRVHYGADWVTCTRHYSEPFLRAIVERLCAYWGWPMPTIKDYGTVGWHVVTNDYRVQEAVWREAAQTEG